MKPTGSNPTTLSDQPQRFHGQSTDRTALASVARKAMIERGLEPDFPQAALKEMASIKEPAVAGDGVRDVRDRLWSSIDNDDSRDLDQLTVAEALTRRACSPTRKTRIDFFSKESPLACPVQVPLK